MMMDEQLEGKLTEILSGILSATKAAGDFALEQLPDIAQSYVMYGRARTVAVTLILLMFAAALLALAKWAYSNPWNSSQYSWDASKKRSDTNYLMMIFSPVFGGTFLLIALLSFDLLVWLAPKVWLLKELASLVK
jgi:hypothetical protein